MSVFLGQWSGADDLRKDFWDDDGYSYKEIKPYAGELDGVNVLLAYYCYESYEGDAFVLFEKDGQLFEVNGGHCSCYGLEGQWEPEETTREALLKRLDDGSLGKSSWGDEDRFGGALRDILK